jgi:hypothetical protein
VIVLKVAVEKGLWGGDWMVLAGRHRVGGDDGRTGAAEDEGAIRDLDDIEKV